MPPGGWCGCCSTCTILPWPAANCRKLEAGAGIREIDVVLVWITLDRMACVLGGQQPQLAKPPQQGDRRCLWLRGKGPYLNWPHLMSSSAAEAIGDWH